MIFRKISEAYKNADNYDFYSNIELEYTRYFNIFMVFFLTYLVFDTKNIFYIILEILFLVHYITRFYLVERYIKNNFLKN